MLLLVEGLSQAGGIHCVQDTENLADCHRDSDEDCEGQAAGQEDCPAQLRPAKPGLGSTDKRNESSFCVHIACCHF
jgi:hypothetical protein